MVKLIYKRENVLQMDEINNWKVSSGYIGKYLNEQANNGLKYIDIFRPGFTFTQT